MLKEEKQVLRFEKILNSWAIVFRCRLESIRTLQKAVICVHIQIYFFFVLISELFNVNLSAFMLAHLPHKLLKMAHNSNTKEIYHYCSSSLL